jgi:glutamate-5-semialdehyde dehydrogenase
VSSGCARAGIPEAAVQLVRSLDRAVVGEMITANAYIDMIIPRGGTGLQRFCVENATIPVITGGIGICHAYVDESADRAKTPPMIVNAKVQRPTVCNALDVVLIHQAAAAELLPAIADALAPHGVELRCDPIAYAILEGKPGAARLGPEDYDTEFLSLRLAIHVVEGLDEALDHIHEHSTHHSDLIITESYSNANRFVDEVDSAAVFVNASTRFNDGAQLGLGAEVAISTQRLHARGPMALRELTTYKWVVLGDGQIRG